MNDFKTGPGNWATNSARNTVLLGYWTAAWVVTMAVATFGPMLIWHSNKLLTILAILVNLGLGLGMILVNIRHLKGLDEMHQKIQLQAMGLALGVGIVAGLSYSLLDITNLIAADAEISHLVILMGLTYGVAVIAGLRKYR
jgi:hypothetical protein